MSLLPCPRCGGDGVEPFPGEFEPCSLCKGRKKIRGRPTSWPAAGALLASTRDLVDRFVVMKGDVEAWQIEGLVPAKRELDGAVCRLPLEAIGGDAASCDYVAVEEARIAPSENAEGGKR